MTLNDSERYSRQILFAGVGAQGQEKLCAARVAIAGCGALGSFQAGALARAGIGFLRLIDRDYVEVSNLQRQWLYDEADAAASLPKAEAARRALKRINSAVHVDAAVADLTASSADDLLGGVDLILDGTDNFETRYLINDYCVSRGVPWVYGAAVGSYGISMPIVPGVMACLRCVYPEPPSGAQPTCDTAGVLASITAAVASLQVTAAMRILTGQDPVYRITTMDVWEGAMRQIQQPPADPNCPACGLKDFRYLRKSARTPVTLCGRNAVQIHDGSGRVNLERLAERLMPLGRVRSNEYALRFDAPPYELTVFPDGRAIVRGTTDPGLARSVYSRYVGA